MNPLNHFRINPKVLRATVEGIINPLGSLHRTTSRNSHGTGSKTGECFSDYEYIVARVMTDPYLMIQ